MKKKHSDDDNVILSSVDIETFQQMTLEQLERHMQQLHTVSTQAQIDLIKCLAYVKATGVWSQNEFYKNDQFKNYLHDCHGLTIKEYQNRVRLIRDGYTSYIIRYGFPIVIEGARIVGTANLKRVLEEIDKKGSSVMSTEGVSFQNLPRRKILLIFEKYRMSVKAINTNWKIVYEAELRAHQETRNKLEETERRLRETQKRLDSKEAELTTLKRRLGLINTPSPKEEEAHT